MYISLSASRILVKVKGLWRKHLQVQKKHLSAPSKQPQSTNPPGRDEAITPTPTVPCKPQPPPLRNHQHDTG
ncbi:hypothetical protein E2C01_011192 [Portunus trituberculatus]|uniref:Uncharacterized protein n=1 Tax=Portunus trituberculatus TaxID=210409 RepID=A0A5B7DAE7_PORTR|nr:hypothetical protein [Portunus trituberculatus]